MASSVLTHTRLIALKDGGEKQELGDISWLVPPGVSVNQDVDLTGSKVDPNHFSPGIIRSAQKLMLF